jgi:uncharacterized membrane protein YphA (DoxX/SURF4 family)
LKYVKLVFIWLFSLFIAFIMIQQGWAKFGADGRWARSFAEWGYPAWFRMLIGVVETGGSLALLVPPVAFYGALALAAVMVGATGTLLFDGRGVDAVTPIAYTVVLVWIAFERRGTRVGSPKAPEQIRQSGSGRARGRHELRLA